MSEKEVEIKEKYELIDQPNVITMMVGGLVISVILYYIIGIILPNWEYVEILQITLGVAVLLLSFQSGRQIDALIRFNTVTGAVYVRNRTQFWEGYAHETSKFLVLEKEEENFRNEVITMYKLYIELSDDTFYEMLLKIDQVTEIIAAAEKCKSITKNSSLI